MKYVPNRLFGYPVLLDEVAEDADYPNKKISAEVKLVLNKADISKYTVIYDLSLDSDTLNKLLHDRKAAFVIRVSCNASLFSKSEVCGSSGSFNISGDDLRDKVEISVFLVATQSLTLGATSKEFHSDYDASEFSISPGMILAYPAPLTYFISKDNFLDVTSIFKWSIQSNFASQTFGVDLDEQKIEIVASESQIHNFKMWMRRDDSKNIALNSVFLSALTYAIEMLKQDREQYEENRWANTILTKCENEKIDISSNRWPSLKVAQRLLHSPIKLLNSSIPGSED